MMRKEEGCHSWQYKSHTKREWAVRTRVEREKGIA